MNETRTNDVWRQIRNIFDEMNKGPNQNVPFKTIWFKASNQGLLNSSELQEMLSWAVNRGLLQMTPQTISGLSNFALTDAGIRGKTKN
jgi:hypothetical protein